MKWWLAYFEYGWHISVFDAYKAHVAIQNWVWGETDQERKSSICDMFSCLTR